MDVLYESLIEGDMPTDIHHLNIRGGNAIIAGGYNKLNGTCMTAYSHCNKILSEYIKCQNSLDKYLSWTTAVFIIRGSEKEEDDTTGYYRSHGHGRGRRR